VINSLFGSIAPSLSCEKRRLDDFKPMIDSESRYSEMDNTLVLQKCTKCNEEKPITEFHKHKLYKTGYRSQCKTCSRLYYEANKERSAIVGKAYRDANKERTSERVKRWNSENKERVSANAKAYYAANKEKIDAYRKNWYEENKEHHHSLTKAWREENRDLFNAQIREWKKANPELVRKYGRDRRVKRRNADGDHTVADIKNLLILQKNKCAVCKTSISKGYHVDHIVAIVNGGTNDKYNLQLLCAPCNLSKNRKDPIDFMQKIGFLL